MLPDIDHPDGSVACSFGFVTKGFAWLIEHVSGGHRHGTRWWVALAWLVAVIATMLPAGRLPLR